MADSSTRAPTPAGSWVSPLAVLSDGNLYPYWNLKTSGLTPYIDTVKRTFAFINPFKVQQIPTHDRAAVGVMYGSKFYRDEPYPNSISFSDKYPSHYDPLADQRFKAKPYTKHVVGANPSLQRVDIIPKFCHRQIRIYQRCMIANDDRSDVCKEEQDNIMSICPTFALDQLRESKLQLLKIEGLDNQKYRRVMQVPAYNKGRTVADVPLRAWGDGLPENLRPSTLWADDRYVDVTEEQVKAAQERVNKRRAANPAKPYHNESYDRKYEVPPANNRFSL